MNLRHITLLALLASCSDEESNSTTDFRCVEPAFVKDTPPDYAPCGCNSQAPDFVSKWAEACPRATHACIWSAHGGTCHPRCTADADCPAHGSGLAAKCDPPDDLVGVSNICVLPCDEGALACPTGFECSENSSWCLHTFMPEPE